MKNIIETKNMSFGYQRNSQLLQNLNLEIKEGDFLGLLGPNGVGKSTLLGLLSSFLKPNSGKIYIEGKELNSISNRERANLIAVVSQNIYSSMPYTVRQIVEMGRIAKVSRLMPFSKKDNDAVYNAMEELDILQYENRKFNTLSGGEKQRVKLATALAQNPKILFLDEPTSQLDMGHAINLMKLIENLNKNKKITIIIVSHDIQLMSSFLQRVIMLKNGKIIADGHPNKIINSKLIKNVYNCLSEIHIDKKERMHIFPAF